MSCDPDHVVIVPSAQQIVALLARLVVPSGAEVGFEDPGYIGARVVLAEHGAKLVPVPVDDTGMIVTELARRARRARLVYVTPGHHPPLGVAMSVERRLALLAWAHARRRSCSRTTTASSGTRDDRSRRCRVIQRAVNIMSVARNEKGRHPF